MPGLKAGPLDLEVSAPAMRPPHLSEVSYLIIIIIIIIIRILF